MKRKETCVLCGKLIVGYGNNPWPLSGYGRCCDECNNLVIMKRLEDLIRKEK